ncbi:hypothetical protein P4S93_09250 [Aneurinibacillus thermoaerophilus]|uniref:YqzN/YkzM domain-containing protein n=1 Tax=Aneurinibacillus thermoaerophilus TaxID=143495 RepID=A0ABX8YGG7_ANETH|nr:MULTISPECIES: hypothetical protein [Aneurinibacillus]AMA72774.1 hypothetical protein ACH33_07845 [Aneurinibacillus sp. XH2]MED0675791.1 hypothetical protein [Aneurinibacillus thermoaerophilus]MED0756914.1 hypothetical protein [Aneurinibacillus thermoaerophilus]MED0760964.1 hypothetical protein [Aneurinibacillus thermoaerophilus]QYY44712.1 hypothetical protein K3F53_10970 [Aneurinibacillus thermoaerophilus]
MTTKREKKQEATAFKHKKEEFMKVAEQKFGLTRTQAIAAFFNAPEEMTLEEAQELVNKFKERTVK